MQIGDRVIYTHPLGGQRRGVLLRISGASALVLYDDSIWPLWGPLERINWE